MCIVQQNAAWLLTKEDRRNVTFALNLDEEMKLLGTNY